MDGGVDFELSTNYQAHLAIGIKNRAQVEIVPEFAATFFVVLDRTAILDLGQY